MKQLLRKPFFFAMLLSLPLWVVFNNYLIAFICALLIAFLASMCYSLYVLRRPPQPTADPAAVSDISPPDDHAPHA